MLPQLFDSVSWGLCQNILASSYYSVIQFKSYSCCCCYFQLSIEVQQKTRAHHQLITFLFSRLMCQTSCSLTETSTVIKHYQRTMATEKCVPNMFFSSGQTTSISGQVSKLHAQPSSAVCIMSWWPHCQEHKSQSHHYSGHKIYTYIVWLWFIFFHEKSSF